MSGGQKEKKELVLREKADLGKGGWENSCRVRSYWDESEVNRPGLFMSEDRDALNSGGYSSAGG